MQPKNNQELTTAQSNLAVATENAEKAAERLAAAQRNLASVAQDLTAAENDSKTKPEDLDSLEKDRDACALELANAETHVAGCAQGLASAQEAVAAVEAAIAQADAATKDDGAVEIWQVRGKSSFTAGPHPTSGKTFNNVAVVTHEADDWIRANVAAGIIEKVGVAKKSKA